MDRFDEIERLGALRDKGLLTEAEFQEQKARLLDPEAAPADPAPADRPAASPTILTIGLAILAFVALVAVVGFALSHRGSPGPSPAAPANSAAKSSAVAEAAKPLFDVNGVMPKAELAAAWKAMPGADRGEASPDYLLESGGQYALVYSASEGDSHADGMEFSVAAMSKDATGYHLIKAYPGVTVSGSFGSADARPIGFGDGARYLRVMGGFTGQGCTVSQSTIVRVAPGKPKEVLSITTLNDNTGEGAPEKPTSVEGKLYPGPRRLTVKYTGTVVAAGVTSTIDRTVVYALKDGAFVLNGPGYDLPGC